MAKCVACGKKSFLLDVAKDEKCWECSLKETKKRLLNDFSISKMVVQKSEDFPTKCIAIAIDDEYKKVAVSGVNTTTDNSFFEFDIYDFKNIVAVDIIEDGQSAISGNIGATVAGGILFGGLGAVAGAAKGRRIKKICNTLSIEMRFNDLSKPVRILEYITKPTKTEGKTYEKAMQNLREAYDLLNYVIIQNEKHSETSAENRTSTADEIRKYKVLLDDGIITQEEFEAKKKQLLGI